MVRYPKKYNSNIFYLAPFYHRIFTQLPKIVVVDVDVVFKSDPIEIWEQFAKFRGSEVLGAAPDLSPHYYQMLQG